MLAFLGTVGGGIDDAIGNDSGGSGFRLASSTSGGSVSGYNADRLSGTDDGGTMALLVMNDGSDSDT